MFSQPQQSNEAKSTDAERSRRTRLEDGVFTVES